MLYLDRTQSSLLVQHLQSSYPNEGCGILLGVRENDGYRVTQAIATANVWQPNSAENSISNLDSCDSEECDSGQAQSDGDSLDRSNHSRSNHSRSNHSLADRYEIAPQEMLAAMKLARSQQWDIIGIYHSHPDHPAQPSECDRALAWPQYIYVIVSIAQGSAVAMTAWQLNESGYFDSIQISPKLS